MTAQPHTAIARFIGSTGQVAAYAALLRDLGYRGPIVLAGTYPHDTAAVPPDEEQVA